MASTYKNPDYYRSVMPYLILEEADRFMAFARAVFGAAEPMRSIDDEGRVQHAEITIGDSTIMVGGRIPSRANHATCPIFSVLVTSPIFSAWLRVGPGRSGQNAHDTRKVQDGPFAETKEQLGGVFILDVPDQDAALARPEKCPAVHWGTIEIRPTAVYSNGGSWARST